MTTIRDYAESDDAQLLTLMCDLQVYERAIYDRMKPVKDIGGWYIDLIKKWCRERDGVILVAERDGELLGYATIMTRVEEDGSADEVIYTYGHVGDLSVRPAARGTGIGKLLLDECERRTRAAGRKWLRIGVLAGNARARSVYERFGFAEHHVMMEKSLT